MAPAGNRAIPPERWQRLKELFHAALEREPLERPAFVEAVCAGDDDLRHELQSLIEAHVESEGFIEVPAMESGPRPRADPLLGTVVEGKYRIDARIGGGGMGVVYRAEHLGLGAPRALKVMNREWLQRPEFVQRFENEAKMAEALVHPHLVRVHDTARLPDGTFCIVSEYVDGETLAHRARRSALLPSEAAHIIGQIADGMDLAHARGILHRDIAPDNILVCETPEGVVAKLVDFGIAKDLARTEEQLTGSGLLLGKVGYASPEQMGFLPRGAPADARTDVFSLAAVLYETLTGRLPWRRDGVQSYVHDLLVRPEADVKAAIAAPLAARWRPVFLRAMARDREARTLDMSTFKREVLSCGPGDAMVATGIEMVGPTLIFDVQTERRTRRRRFGAVGAGVAVLALVAGAIALRGPAPPTSPAPAVPATLVAAAPTSVPMPALPEVTASPRPGPAATTPPVTSRPIAPPSTAAVAWPAASVAPPPTTARVLLQSATAASVALDGESRGRTPLVLEGVAAGRHLLVVTADDGRVVEDVLELKPGETLERRLHFPGYGSLSVVSPIWAEVRIDDGPAQQTPCRFERIPAGRHVLRSSRAGYRDQAVEIDIVDGETRELRLDLERAR